MIQKINQSMFMEEINGLYGQSGQSPKGAN